MRLLLLSCLFGLLCLSSSASQDRVHSAKFIVSFCMGTPEPLRMVICEAERCAAA